MMDSGLDDGATSDLPRRRNSVTTVMQTPGCKRQGSVTSEVCPVLGVGGVAAGWWRV